MKNFKAFLVALIASGIVGQAWAADFPERPVKVIVPFAPSPAEAVIRLITDKLRERWGQPVIVENRPGAGGNLAAMAGARATPDGYTLLVVTDPMMTVNPLMYRKPGFDPVADFLPVTTLLEFPSAVVISQKSPLKTLRQVFDFAKASPNKLTYASWGVGSAPHLGMEQMKKLSGTEILHVPYKGLASVEMAMLSGEVDIAFFGVGNAARGQKSGTWRPLAVAGTKRDALLPDVPTFAEAGLPEMKGPNWWGIVVPAKTPKAVVVKLSSDIAAVLKDADFRDRLVKQYGYHTIGDSPESFAERINDTSRLWTPVVKSLKIEME